jgi:alkyldihydroxyacetonephosphate synthase
VTAPRDGDLARQLCAVVGDSHVQSSSSLAAIGVKPQPGDAPAWLVKPGSASEIAELVRLAYDHEVAVIPVGNAARAPKSGGLRDRIRFYVDLRRMDHVLHLDETSLVVHVQAGLTAIALEKILAQRGLSVGDYPPVTLGSTVGGLLSVRTPGKSSSRHGFVEDAVLGVSAVLADGRSIHTRIAPRRSTGPDLARALCGSEGALGLITSAVLRIHRRPETRYLAAYTLPSVGDALAAVRLALREEAAPAAMRLYDHGDARARFRGIELADGAAVLVCATAGPTDLAACDRGLIESAVAAMGGQTANEELARTWWARRTGQAPAPELPLPHIEVSATPGKVKAVYQAMQNATAARATGLRAHISRFDADGAVVFATLVDNSDVPLADDRVAELRPAVETAARETGAYLLGSSNPAMEPYFQRLRDALDPRRIMNPGVLGRAPERPGIA